METGRSEMVAPSCYESGKRSSGEGDYPLFQGEAQEGACLGCRDAKVRRQAGAGGDAVKSLQQAEEGLVDGLGADLAITGIDDGPGGGGGDMAMETPQVRLPNL
jgi:hypothetical protein